MIKRIPVQAFRERLFCDECGGEMVSTGTAHPTGPIQYPHRCSKCGKTKTVRGMLYPRIVYEEADDAK